MGSEAKILRAKDVPTPAGASLPVVWLDLGGRTDVAVPLVRLAEAVGYREGDGVEGAIVPRIFFGAPTPNEPQCGGTWTPSTNPAGVVYWEQKRPGGAATPRARHHLDRR
jgi:hypothetical protein